MRWWCAIFAVVLLALAACSGGPGRFAGALPAVHPATSAPRAAHPPAAFPALRAATDAEDQYLSGVAEHDGVLAAAGGTHSSGVWRPLFLFSDDDGRTWRRAATAPSPDATVDDTVDSVVVHGDRFYGFGTASGGAAVWTSPDARHWARHAIDRSAIGPGDHVTDLAGTDRGFVAVGFGAEVGPHVPQSWTSADGLHWVKHTGRAAGLAGSAAGDVQMLAVTSGGAGFVAVGSEVFRHGEREKPRAWRSTEGARWSAVALPQDLAGAGTRSWFNDVAWTGTAYVAVGAGGSGENRRYAGAVAYSPNARTWTGVSDGPGLVTGRQVYLGSVTFRRGQTVAFGLQCSAACTLYGVTDRARPWRPLRLPIGGEGDSMGAGDVLTTKSGAVVAVGSANPGHDRDPRIWRSADGRSFTRARLPSVATGRQAVYVSDIARDAHRYLVVGTSGGLPVVWSSPDGRHYGRPTALSADRAVSASTITHGPAGWLVTGSESVGESEQALVWTSADGVHWQRSRSGRFGRAGIYAYSELNAAVPWRGWVAVGDQSADGLDDQSAIAVRTRDGRAWHSAVNTSRAVPVGGRRVIRDDLRGDHNGNRGMSGVAVVGGGLLAVGTAQAARGTVGREAAVWRSADAARWTLGFLPRGSAQSANAAAVAGRGATVAVYGTVQTGTVTKGVIWSSRDAGRTWRLQALPGDGGARVEVHTDVLVTTAGGFVAGGSVGRAGAGRPAMWASRTGSIWQPVALTDARLAGGGDWTLDGAVTAGDQLIGIATRTDARGSVPIAFIQRVA